MIYINCIQHDTLQSLWKKLRTEYCYKELGLHSVKNVDLAKCSSELYKFTHMNYIQGPVFTIVFDNVDRALKNDANSIESLR